MIDVARCKMIMLSDSVAQAVENGIDKTWESHGAYTKMSAKSWDGVDPHVDELDHTETVGSPGRERHWQ